MSSDQRDILLKAKQLHLDGQTQLLIINEDSHIQVHPRHIHQVYISHFATAFTEECLANINEQALEKKSKLPLPIIFACLQKKIIAKRYSEALKLLQIHVDRNNTEKMFVVVYNTSKIFLYMKNFKNSAFYLESLLKEFPFCPDAIFDLVLIYAQIYNRKKQAILLLQRHLLGPLADHPLIHSAFLTLVNSFPISVSTLSRQLSNHKFTLTNYFNLALLFKKKEAYARSEQMFQQIKTKLLQYQTSLSTQMTQKDSKLLIMTYLNLIQLKQILQKQKQTQNQTNIFLQKFQRNIDATTLKELKTIVSNRTPFFHTDLKQKHHQKTENNQSILKQSKKSQPYTEHFVKLDDQSIKNLKISDSYYTNIRSYTNRKLQYLLQKQKQIDSFFKNVVVKRQQNFPHFKMTFKKSIKSVKDEICKYKLQAEKMFNQFQEQFQIKKNERQSQFQQSQIQSMIKYILSQLQSSQNINPFEKISKTAIIYQNHTGKHKENSVKISNSHNLMSKNMQNISKIQRSFNKVNNLAKIEKERPIFKKIVNHQKDLSYNEMKTQKSPLRQQKQLSKLKNQIEIIKTKKLNQIIKSEVNKFILKNQIQVSETFFKNHPIKIEKHVENKNIQSQQKNEQNQSLTNAFENNEPSIKSNIQADSSKVNQTKKELHQLTITRKPIEQTIQQTVNNNQKVQKLILIETRIQKTVQTGLAKDKESNKQEKSSTQSLITERKFKQNKKNTLKTKHVVIKENSVELKKDQIKEQIIQIVQKVILPPQQPFKDSNQKHSQPQKNSVKKISQITKKNVLKSNKSQKQIVRQSPSQQSEQKNNKIPQSSKQKYDPLASSFQLTGFNNRNLKNFDQKAKNQPQNKQLTSLLSLKQISDNSSSKQLKQKLALCLQLQKIGKYEESYQSLTSLYKLHKLQTEKELIMLAIGSLFQVQQKYAECEKTYIKCTKYNSAAAFLRLGNLQLRLGKIQQGVQNLQKANCIKRNDLQIQNKLVYGYSLRQQTMSKALTLAHNILKRNPNSIQTLIMTAGILQKQGLVKQAIEIVQQIDKINGTQYIKHYLGILYLQDSNLRQAFNFFKAALAIKPDYIPSLIEVASIISDISPKQAIEILKKVLQIEPNNRKALARLGKIYESIQGDFENAMITYHLCLETQENYESYMKIGDCLAKKTSYIQALLNYKEALNLKKTHEAYAKVALMFQFKGELPKAIENYQSALTILGKGTNSQKQREYLISMGKLSYKIGQYDEAITAFEQALQKEETSLLLKYLGQSYFGKRQFETALQNFQKANNISNGQNIQILQCLAICLDQMEEYLASKTIYQKIISKDPQNIRCLNNLANILLLIGETNQAFEVFENLLQKCPKNVERRLKVSDIYAEVGDWSKVQYHLLQCYRLKEHDPIILQKLVALYKEKRDTRMTAKYEKKLMLLKSASKSKAQ